MKLSTLAFPLGVSPRGSLDTVSGSARVQQGVAMFFATPRGARPLVPEFGYPELPPSDAFVPGWAAECEDGLTRTVFGVAAARVLVAIDLSTGRLVGTVRVRTDGGEELNYDIDPR
ncbi:hypothetical protein [Deinococcus kurensis]|uniref:hypothetical protein n=1 Tax=Deinococcus kurensis TaxID=2662757 RepID=UPI0012D2DBF5|nr:hypothetical protein [Deinococcus kurensis]